MSQPAYRFRACGFEIESHLAISHLLPGDPAGAADLLIRTADTTPPFPVKVASSQWRLGQDRVHLFGLGEEEALCIAGRELVLTGVPDRLDQTCTILGRALAVIGLQRRLAVLHAVVVERDGRALAVAGRSGAGKSTLARTLIAQGFRLLADDIAVCKVNDAGVVANPLFPSTRRLAKPGTDRDWQAIPGTQKQVSTSVPFCPQPRRIERLFVVEVRESEGMHIVDLDAADAVGMLEAHCYRKGLARALLGFDGLREQMTQAAGVLPVTRVVRPHCCDPADLALRLLARMQQP